MEEEYDNKNSDTRNHNHNFTTTRKNSQQSILPHARWGAAATAKNGNSLVPGASFFVFSKPSALRQVFQDTVIEWYYLQRERLRETLTTTSHKARQNATGDDPHQHTEKDLTASIAALMSHVGLDELPVPPAFLKRSDDFRFVPPYFALHLFHCLGLARNNSTMHSPEERWSFVRFVKQYLYYTLWMSQEDAQRRTQTLHKLASANRNIYLQEVIDNELEDSKTKKLEKEKLRDTIGHSKGFLSLYRTQKEALAGLDLLRDFGEDAELIPWDEALAAIPRLQNMPFCGGEKNNDNDSTTTTTRQPMYVVRRSNDYSASCEAFVRHWVKETQNKGVHYEPFSVHSVATITVEKESQTSKLSNNNSPRRSSSRISTDPPVFQVTTSHGTTHEFDVLILSAGIHTPLLAAQIKAQDYCPTYPLRGFSLTVYAWQQEQIEQSMKTSDNNNDNDQQQQQQRSRNLLWQPMKLDGIYCSSASPFMARWVGFGEFCGYHATAKDVPSLGPKVLVRYAKTLIPDHVAVHNNSSSSNHNASSLSEDDVLPCFRCLSPDDLPIVGEVSAVPGLFLHTGHGSLGWTMGLATGDCLAQAIHDKLVQQQQQQSSSSSSTAENDKPFVLPDGTTIRRSELSPDRFVSD